jgi:hypothetical protein
MAQAITMDIYQLLEGKLGREEAARVASAIEVGLEVIEKKAEAVALQKKLELKDELTKELATKADLLLLKEEVFGEMRVLRQEMETLRQEMKADILRLEGKVTVEILRLDRKFTIMFVVLFFTIIFLNQNALEFLARILGLIK